jgi:thiamine-phosphate pyrophosphorylase
MAESCLLYYITDRTGFPGDDRTRRLRLLDKIAEAASHGVDYIQLREKDLPARELESLAREAVRVMREVKAASAVGRPSPVLLINSRTDVALASGAGGVHLRGDDVSVADVRAAWASAGEVLPEEPLIGVSCHSPQEVVQAAADRATFAVFAPVFEKKDAPGSVPTGLEALREACRATIPVLALGGVTGQNAESCRKAGAAGVAGVRLFQENDIGAIVRKLRG